ncbi:S8 family serine peptidase [Streptomyces sp. NPDC088725]|uniref:S8 family serine peptidase n=1 Tax=Streptomyces sp. NPDC088725 TaxID=3365873 RepID=UPI0037F97F75
MRRTRLPAAVSMVLLLTAGAVAPVSAAPSARGPAVGTSGAVDPGATVRLITGDRVTVAAGADGKRAATVRPGPGRQGVLFKTVEQDGDLTVLPSDALDLISAGTLDRQLFDVSALIAQGYDEAHTDALPLIVSQESGATAARRDTLSALSALNDDSAPSLTLESINARSLRVAGDDLGRFWKELAPAAGGSASARIAATPKIWLDGKVSADLDRSTGQINAPAAWDAGYQGKGVKVAVLDTGVDQTHPDLAGRVLETKDFSGSGNTNDIFGHGTHVASIVGGTGAASGGTRKGVASQAELMVGKVLGDDGYGSQSQIIEGMEWAAAEGARVVNMSLGSETPTDGTDPMSAAVDELTASTGTLFVVAAGNSGESGAQSIGTPGAADAALTVGAVDRDDSLAPFSSRGPRVGDKAVKPDVTAPGVDIVAAKAAGTLMGEPVDEYYVAASGTSMATPHVAGAAALLAQEHPDWQAQQLKDALISTARTVPGRLPTEQGGGRIDLAAAALGSLTATGTVALGPLQTGGTGSKANGPAGATIRYTNASKTAVSLRLTARLATTDGQKPRDGAVTLGASSVQVAPGATADVPLTADASLVERGDYYGYVTATSADGAVVLHTTVSLVVKRPTHRLTVTTLDHNGKRVDALPALWGSAGFVDYESFSPAVAEVEEGTYQLSYTELDDASDGQELREVVLPEVKITKDASVTLDARTTTQVEIRTPKPAEQRGALTYQTYRQIDGKGLIQGTMFYDVAKRLYVSPTARVIEGTFEFASRWQLVAPMLDTEVRGAKIELDPYYMPNSPLFSAKGERLTAVDAGAGDAPDLRAARVRGKLVVVRDDGVNSQALTAAAAKAGAKGVVMIVPSDMYPWTRWRPDGERYALPAVRVSAAGGDALLQRVKKQTTEIAISGTAASPYLYDVMQISAGQIPQHVVHTVSDSNSAQVRTTYADNGPLPWTSEQRFGWRPYQDTAWNQYSRYAQTGTERTEYITSGDTLWQHFAIHTPASDPDTPLTSGMQDTTRTYRAGARTGERWFGAVVRPSIPAGTATPSTRSGDLLALHIAEFTDSTAGHWSRPATGGDGGIGTSGAGAARTTTDDTVSVSLYRDGAKVGTADNAGTDFTVAPGKAGYRLDVSTARVSDAWEFGTETATSWSFRSDTTSKEAPLPLLQLDYDVSADGHNEVRQLLSHDIGVTVRNQPGLDTPRGVRVQVEESYDDGRTWTKAALVKDRGQGTFNATFLRSLRVWGDTHVSLRVTATDAAGNSVKQTVERAYLLKG